MKNADAETSKPLPAFRAVARALERQVLSGDLKVGSALPGEQALGERFGVSRSTIREAIRALEQIGLIRRQEGRHKLLVTVPGAADLNARMRATFLLQEVTFDQLWEVLAAIEPACAESAARHAAPLDLRSLADNLKRTEDAHAAGRNLVELDIEFHALIAQATGNGALQVSRQAVGELFYPAFSPVMLRLNAGDRLLLAHRKILAALEQRDSQEARAWMTRHINDFKRGCELGNLAADAPITGPFL